MLPGHRYLVAPSSNHILASVGFEVCCAIPTPKYSSIAVPLITAAGSKGIP
jgi:hypothetical protein